ncbi:UDP-Glycosyltransferase superfamily protein [Perilla frutescens var. hirtella]|nr:UDP-Glycosyltransferase superfamily protein [Perilla frutescens var. hirtella]
MAENARNTTSTVHIRLRFFAQLNTPQSASTFHFLGAFSTSISRHFQTAFLSLKQCLSYSARLQFIAAFNQIITSATVVLTAFLQLKYPNSSPFSTHPTAMSVAVSCSAVYCLASAAALRFHLHPLVLLAHHLSLSFAYISVASLASVLLPDSATPFVYSVFGSLSAAELLFFLLCKFDCAEFEVRRWCFRRFFNEIWRGVGNSSELLLQRLPI